MAWGAPAKPAAQGDAAGTHLALEWVALVALVAWFVTHTLLPAWKELHTDFPNYYLAARLFRGGYPLEHMYDWVWFQRQKDHAGIDWGIVSYGPITPFSALVLAPVASLSALAAKRVWIVLNLALLGGCIPLLRALTTLPIRRIAIITLLTVVPLQTNFDFGQQYVLLLFLLLLAAWLSLRGRDALSGATLALSTVLKLYPAIFVLLFLVRRRWSALSAFVATTALAIGAGIAALGVGPFRVYVTQVLPRISAGEVHDPYYLSQNTPTVLLRRLFVREPELNPLPLFDARGAFVALQPAVQAFLLVSALWILARRRTAPAHDVLLWGAFTALSLVLSTSASTYHFCTLILATVVAVDRLLAAGKPRLAFVLVVLHALVCSPLNRFAPVSPDGLRVFLGTPRLYALLAYGCAFLFAITRVSSAVDRKRWQTPAFAGLFVALTSFGIFRTSHHFEGMFDSYASRLPTTTEPLVATSPTVSQDGLYFSAMGAEAYSLDRAGARRVRGALRGADMFHPTAARDRSEGWVELSGRTSRVARISLNETAFGDMPFPIEIEDAEQPTASPDGRWLGFLREESGRTGLWVTNLIDAHVDAASPHAERKIVAASHDVQELAFFSDGRIVFSSNEAGRSHLFTTQATGGPLVSLETEGRYPSVSPDDAWLVYSRLEHGAFQLEVMKLATRETRTLTHADCNSMSPVWSLSGASLVYASDCGRGLGTTALCEMPFAPW